ncbi:unnamed protein product [Lota lota]
MEELSLNHANVKVAVRVRPMNRRERDMKTKCVVEMSGNQTLLHPANLNLSKDDPRTQPKVFAYDHCFWSMDESRADVYAGQEVVFQCLGDSLLDNAFLGYNACICAYGQTGSGKSYTMMGSAEQPGLIPRLCCSLFSRTLKEAREGEVFTVEVSYLEIYNEKVRDLLDPKGGVSAGVPQPAGSCTGKEGGWVARLSLLLRLSSQPTNGMAHSWTSRPRAAKKPGRARAVNAG